MNEDNKVLVDAEELAQLREDQAFLRALMAAGVDNWEGYDMVCEEWEWE